MIEKIFSFNRTNILILIKIFFDRDFRRNKVPIWLLSLAIFLNGLINLYYTLNVELPYKKTLISTLFSIRIDSLNKTMSLLFGFILIYLALQILNKKQMAWNISFLILFLTIFNHLIRIESWYTFLIPLISIIILILTRTEFTSKSEFNRIEDGILISLVIFLGALTYGLIGFWVLGEKIFFKSFSIFEAILNTIEAFVFLNPNLSQNSIFADWFITSLHILGVITLLLIIISLFMPVLYVFKIQPEERELAKEILIKYGNSAIDYFKLWSDKTLFFSKDKEAFIAYRVKYGVAICLGDPSGPKDIIKIVINEFEDFCRRNGWKIAFHHTKDDFLSIYEELKFHSIKIGEEGTIDIEKFMTSTIKQSDFKRSLKKFTLKGYVLTLSKPPHSEALLNELKQISDEWLSTGRRERSFTLGKFSKGYLQTTPVVLLRDSNKKLMAFLNQIDSYIQDEITIDMMRHRKDIPNGTMDFIFCSYLSQLHSEGIKFFSMGLSHFTGLNSQNESPLLEKIMNELFEHLKKSMNRLGKIDILFIKVIITHL
jgi:phosphatidylglycerol lysyltransferase